MPLTEPGPAAERLGRFGVLLTPAGDLIDVVSVKFHSKAEKAGFQQGQKIIAFEVEADRPSSARAELVKGWAGFDRLSPNRVDTSSRRIASGLRARKLL
jgi:hypothetical protein